MLTLIVFIPLAAALALLLVNKENTGIIRSVSVGAAGLSLLISLALLARFDTADPDMQFVTTLAWVPMFHINYQVGVDGISLWLVVLTAFISFTAVYFSLDHKDGFRNFMALMLALEAGTLGVFVALDMILFYVFWELMLIPTYFLIGIWGEGRRIFATTKFVLYTLVGSLLMLVGILWLSFIHFEATHELTFDIQTLVHMKIGADVQFWMFWFFFLAFAIKVPIFPLHSWLPHAYVSCPIPALLILTGAMSKAGAYGLIRFCLPLFPDAVDDFGPLIAFGAAAGIVYGAWIAIAQRDLKALVAYSSISHLGFIALGIFALNGEGIGGSVLQMVNHGIIASALFIIVGILEKKMGTRNLNDFRGLGKAMPVLYGMFMLITLAALGLPGLNGFVGEFLILMGVWTSHLLAELSTVYVLMGGLAIVFASIYMLYMFQGAMQEKGDKLPDDLTDINRGEFGLLLPACILVVVIGLYPKPFIDRVAPSVESVLTIEKTLNLHAGEDKGGHH
ncbi:NADH-quinone oxidoreductase, subunit M [Candidatus Nitromaritima sp. SCGC AAA799-A02]|nr:NADH-quinone oxidoreductase, subunit M [Candidatus Nitromaritima sp. SCGC AAA799-A02]